MSNPFKKLAPDEEVPKELKSKVMNSINYAKFIGDVAELFSLKYIETLGNLFSTEEGKKSTNKHK